MDWKDVTGVVAKLAPMIATSFGGPLAGAAVTALGDALGLKMTGTLDQQKETLTTAMSALTGDQLVAIKKAEQDFAVQMATLGFKNVADLEGIASADRDSARKREVSVKDHTPKILAYAITGGFFSVLGVLLFGEVATGSKDVLYIMLGTLGTAWGGVVSYYFGSTAGSAEKNKLLAETVAAK